MVADMFVGGAIGRGAASFIGGAMPGGGAAAPESPVAPPPIPTLSYHVAIGGEAKGPFGAGELQAMAESGCLTLDTLVWRQGMANWVPARTEPTLRALIEGRGKSSPPPIPHS